MQGQAPNRTSIRWGRIPCAGRALGTSHARPDPGVATAMIDLAFVVLTAAFFAASIAYLRALEKI